MTTLYAPIIPFGVENALRGLSFVPRAVVLTPAAVLRYGDQYERMYTTGPRPEITFINGGVGDTDKPQPFAIALDAAVRLNANYLILPDAQHDAANTMKVSRSAQHRFKKRVETDIESSGVSVAPLRTKLIGVPQGSSYDEYVDCANNLVDMGVDGLGVSRNIYEIDRYRANYVLAFRSLGVPVHMLGFSKDLDDDIYCCNLPGVESISSAMPVWYGQHHKLLPHPWVHDTGPFGPRPKTFFGSDDVTTELLANLFIVSSWLGGAIPCAS